MANEQIKPIHFNGKLITSVDPILIGENFRSLKNLRYTNGGIKAISGMSKINSTALSSYPKIRNVYHYTKDYHSESHVLVQAFNSGETESKIFRNDTAIPSTGDFTATALYTDASGAGIGRFSGSPMGEVAYCNGKASCIWSGDEHRISKFLAFDPNTGSEWDYTNQVTNTINDSSNVGKFNSISNGIDSNVMLMLHLNNNVTDDSPTTPHTVTNSNCTFDSAVKKFGSHSLELNGANARLTIPDNADFDFSAGTFTIDLQIRLDTSATNPIYRHETDANNYFNYVIESNNSVHLVIVAAGSTVVDLQTPASTLTTGTWYHIELVENGDNWYIFVDGNLKAYVNDTSRAANYTGSVNIGYNGVNWFDGRMDEIRISNSSRHTSQFTPPSQEYSSSTTASYVYIGTVRPVKGFEFYVSTANANSSTMDIQYWTGSSWASVTNLSDGTASGGVSMAQEGWVTFDSTEAIAKPKIIHQILLYWYKVYISSTSANTSVYHVTCDMPFQTVKDLWDGDIRTVLSFQKWDNSANTFIDNTINIYSEDYSSANTATFAQIGSLKTSDYLVCGFTEQMMGLSVVLVGGATNTTSATILSVSYWGGSAWQSVGTIEDGTIEGGKTFAKTGVIAWNAISSSSEFKREISKEAPLYYYKLVFSAQLSADVKVDFIGGIPSPQTIGNYKFPFFADNRLYLCSNQNKDKNSVLVSAKYSSSVFNGVDSQQLFFGDDKELVASGALYSQLGSNIYTIKVFLKENQTWLLIGDGPNDWQVFQASDTIGCIAPLTLQVAHVGFELAPGRSRYVAIWQGSEGIYLFDSQSIKPIHGDISDYFDPRNSYSINRNNDVINKSVSFFDDRNKEYHWLVATGNSTTLDKEFIFDLERMKWFEIDRGTGKKLQCGCEVADTRGNKYTYGFIDTGYLERLENGNTMDGSAIDFEVHFGDITFDQEGGVAVETDLRKIDLYLVAKSTTTNSVTVTHYGDTKTTATGTFTSVVSESGKRVKEIMKGETGPYTLHSIKLNMSTNNESFGFEPLFMNCVYKRTRMKWS